MTTADASPTLVYTFVRLRPQLAAQHPSIPADTWHPVRPCYPNARCSPAEPGLVCVEVDGRLRKLPTEYFEFTTSNPW
ncbi:MAG TPA: hypothetical protein VFH24_06135 [Gemmatimonadales bacterium]|nr:hypothetical protein [Gemmatimonadales bacterium]